MLAFENDYSHGCHPEILRRLAETNMMPETGYGQDSFSASAAEKIRRAAGCPDAAVFFLTGGTQANMTVLDFLLTAYQGVMAVETGHINGHEAGAVEATGHKVLPLPEHDGKMDAGELRAYMENLAANNGYGQLAEPGAVYISYPTEYGTLYTKKELEEIKSVCRAYDLKLFIDGARLAYGLASPACDLTLPELASLCDVFYIGGTKVGALCGEAVVFPDKNTAGGFYLTMKLRGAMPAKGRLCGLQFDVLFTDGLYEKLGKKAVDAAMRMKRALVSRGIELLLDSPTNQQFAIVSAAQYEWLKKRMRLLYMNTLADGRVVVRFVTCWATEKTDIGEFESLLDAMPA